MLYLEIWKNLKRKKMGREVIEEEVIPKVYISCGDLIEDIDEYIGKMPKNKRSKEFKGWREQYRLLTKTYNELAGFNAMNIKYYD